MGQRALMAFFLSLCVIMGYNYFFAQKHPALNRYGSGPTPTAQRTFEQQARSASADAAAAATEQRPFLSTQLTSIGTDFVVETDLVRLVLTSSGARIKSCQLKMYPEEKIDINALKRQLNELTRLQESASAEQNAFLQRERSKQEILLQRLAGQPDRAELVSPAARLDADFSPTITLFKNEQANFILNTTPYSCAQQGLMLNQDRPEGSLEFSYTDSRGWTVRKAYTFHNSNYNIELDISIRGWSPTELSAENFFLFYGPDVGMPLAQRGKRAYGYQGPISCFQTGEQSWVQKEKYASNESGTSARRTYTKERGRILWTGLSNKYFLAALIPAQPAKSLLIEKNRFGEQKIALAMPWTETAVYRFKLYLGPKKEDRLREVDATLVKAMDYGFFGPIARFIYQTLVFISRWTHNFGWAIVLLCLFTKVVFHPLTHRSFESMQKMQQQMKEIQPEMNVLREKLKDNPKKLNKEIMALYRKRGVNPMGSCQSGCLPMVLQMPVFFALYAVLYNSIELRGAPFLGWVKDLSAKDPYYILPILMGVSMFLQQKLTGIDTAGSAQQAQAKLMSILMPVMLTWIFASLPSGVVLYWFTFNIVTALHQLLIKKRAAPALAEAEPR